MPRLCPRHGARRHYQRELCATITPANGIPRHRPRPVAVSRGHAPSCGLPCPVVRSRCGRARCPHRAAAPWRGARLGIPRTLRVLHAAACQRGLPARGTVHGRAAHPVRCLAAGFPGSRRHYSRALPTRITRAARWGHRALPPLHPPFTPLVRTARTPLPCAVAVGRDAWPPGLPARAAAPSTRCAAWHPAHRAPLPAVAHRPLPAVAHRPPPVGALTTAIPLAFANRR